MATRRNAPARRYEEVDVTPAMAREWLDNMIENNRKERKRATAKYARDMAIEVDPAELNDDGTDQPGVRIEVRDGKRVTVPCRWLITGDTVKIGPDGRMWDGGQRMRALLQAKELNPALRSIRMVIAYNVPASGFKVTDSGAKRTVAEKLQFEGVEHHRSTVGAILRRITLWQMGNRADARGSNSALQDPTDTELIKVFHRHALLFEEAARRGEDVRSQGLGTSTAAGTAYFLFNGVSDLECKGFFENLITPLAAGMNERSAVWQLRERLRRTSSKANRYESLSTSEQLFLYVKAWNHYRHDEPVERLQLPRNGISNANFPKPE